MRDSTGQKALDSVVDFLLPLELLFCLISSPDTGLYWRKSKLE